MSSGADSVQQHVARDFVDRVVAADVLHVDQRSVLLAQHAAVDRAGLQIQRRLGVDLARQLHRARRFAAAPSSTAELVERLHQVAEHGPLRTARCLHLLLQLLLEVGLPLGPHDDGLRYLLVVDRRDLVVRRSMFWLSR